MKGGLDCKKCKTLYEFVLGRKRIDEEKTFSEG